MKDNKKRGFTLVEAVLCVAIIGVLAMGYLYLTGGSANVFRAGTDYDRRTSELIEAAHDGVPDEGMTESIEKNAASLSLSDELGITLAVDRVTLSGGSSEGSMYYYAYSTD